MSSKTAGSNVPFVPISDFHYRPTIVAPKPVEMAVEDTHPDHELRLTEEALRKSLAAERAAAVAETQARMRQEYEQKLAAETQRISKTIEHFEQSRREYFLRVETEVVSLALSIAAKILHREAQVDPLLVAAIVQVALDQLREGAAASIRVRPEEVKLWQQHFASQKLGAVVTVMADADLQPKDCLLETELGTVNFSLEVQLKEVEKGFFDVLAQRPTA